MQKGFTTFSYVMLFIYIIFSLGSCYFNLKGKKSEKAFLKLFLMPTLTLFYILTFKNYKIFVLLALLFSWFGDIILIKHNTKNVILGILFFSTACVFYTVSMIGIVKFTELNYILTIFVFVICFVVPFFINSFIREYSSKILKRNVHFSYIYGFCVGLLLAMSLLVLTSNYRPEKIYLFFGSTLLLISSVFVGYLVFYKQNKIANAILMLTYTVAQFLLVSGFGYIFR